VTSGLKPVGTDCSGGKWADYLGTLTRRLHRILTSGMARATLSLFLVEVAPQVGSSLVRKHELRQSDSGPGYWRNRYQDGDRLLEVSLALPIRRSLPCSFLRTRLSFVWLERAFSPEKSLQPC